jgi:hypothetical protein
MVTALTAIQYEGAGSSAGQANLETMPTIPPRAIASPDTRTLSAKSSRTTMSSPSAGPVKTPATVRTFEMPLQPLVRTSLTILLT